MAGVSMMAEAAHARLAPSGADRWGPGRCPRSPAMEAAYPVDQESPEAIEGTAAHHYLAEALHGRMVTVGALAPNGHPINREMVDCAEDIIRDIRDTLKQVADGVLRIEQRAYAPELVHRDNWGTPDAYLPDRARRVLHVWDYKYGHRYVDAFENWQLLDYAIAILESEGVPYAEWAAWNITLTIAQPRNYHPDGPLREWYLTGVQLQGYAQQLRAAALATDDPGAPLVTGEHCRDCRARAACPALERTVMRLVDMSLTGQPIDLPPPALGLELMIIRAAMKRLGARAVGLEEQALAMARRGVSIPHWRAEYSYGRKRWKDDMPADQIAALGEALGLELMNPAKPITPTQAAKAGLDPSLVDAFSDTPRGAMALVPFDDKDIAKRFG